MARTGSIETNNRRKRLEQKYAAKRMKLKKSFMDKNADMDLSERMRLSAKMAKLPRNASPVRFRSRCAISGRPRGVYGAFQLARMVFRSQAMRGHLPGVTRSSW